MNYNSMKATKVEKKPYSNISISRNSTNSAKKIVKKINANWFLVFVVIVIGIVGGYFANNYLFKNDIYEMVMINGEIDVVLGGSDDDVMEVYVEPGVKCIAFGKDYSKECTVKYFYRSDLTEDEKEVSVEDININNPGVFYAVYDCPNLKYSTVKLIRNIIVLRGEDNG